MTVRLAAEGLDVSIGGRRCIEALDLAFRTGESWGVLGPNGAGKTTTLRAVYGLLKPDTGSIRIDDIDVTQDLVAATTHMGIFPDTIGLYDRLTTREHLQFYGEMHGLEGAELKSAIERTKGYFKMDDLLDRRCKGFSHGQQMKVALSRALIHQPQNLILDEPTNGLDVMSIRLLRDLLNRLRDEGRCILFSSHVMQEVSALCDHIYIMAAGRVVAHGSPDELCEQTGEEHLEDAFVSLVRSAVGEEAA